MEDTRAPTVANRANNGGGKNGLYAEKEVNMLAEIYDKWGSEHPFPFTEVTRLQNGDWRVWHLRFADEERDLVPSVKLSASRDELEHVMRWCYQFLWSRGWFHGDMNMTNYAVRNGQVYLIDWEPGLFGRVESADAFWSTLGQELYEFDQMSLRLCGEHVLPLPFEQISFEEGEKGVDLTNPELGRRQLAQVLIALAYQPRICPSSSSIRPGIHAKFDN